MTLLLVSLGTLVGSGMLALLAGRSARLATVLGVGGTIAGSVLGAIPAITVLGGGAVPALYRPWEVPYGSFALELDALSAWFLLLVLGVCSLAAVYGSEYLLAHAGEKRLGGAWFFYNLLTASMMLVLLARNGVLFLVAWEVMALASFFLVTFDDTKASVRQAGWIYLVATHLGTAFLLVLFALLGAKGGPLDFARFTLNGLPAAPSLLFLLAVVGFGTKAGFMPLHVWLPEAHPAAPSHVSAVMSGVMIKTGIYGLLRTLTFLGSPPAWWGWLLIGIGLLSGVLGVLFALAQRDLKRLLAYSSVENIGIIALALGVGLIGQSRGSQAIAVLGFAGALLHVANHAMFKSMLFLGAGSVLHSAGTADMEQLGGLLKKMRWVGAGFLVGAAAIAGLPPLNGFVGEFLIYLAAIEGGTRSDALAALPLLAVLGGMALIGGLAAACFARTFGMVFLGEPRSDAAAGAHAPGLLMQLPMLVLAAGCVLVGLLAPHLVGSMTPVLAAVLGTPMGQFAEPLAATTALLGAVTTVAVVLLGLILGLVVLRWRLLEGRPVGASETWGCGYAQPTPRMQYTASSFAQPFTDWFAPLLQTRKQSPQMQGYFPAPAKLHTETPEIWQEKAYQPTFLAVRSALARLRWLQQGQVQVYVLYIALTIFFLLVWYLGLAA
ncbi:hypothetical protein AYO44_03990 [Planctomycetaceae bacterium SCGC AG-212-F19]|nr:hypothetical protein AYO44_03990 [Planctomycetaceae bacterium SCGC AG-212-F19]